MPLDAAVRTTANRAPQAAPVRGIIWVVMVCSLANLLGMTVLLTVGPAAWRGRPPPWSFPVGCTGEFRGARGKPRGLPAARRVTLRGRRPPPGRTVMRMGVRAWLDRWGDWLLAAVLALSEFDIWVRTLPGDQPVTSGRAAAAGLFLLVTLPLAWRRRDPVAVLFIVIAAAVCAAFAIRPSQGPVTSFIALIVAFYSVAANCAERRALLAGGIGLALRRSSSSPAIPGPCPRARWRSWRWPG